MELIELHVFLYELYFKYLIKLQYSIKNKLFLRS